MSTVLVIESDKWLGDHYQRLLEKQGYQVLRSLNGHDAIDIIDDNMPAAIVMSLLLNGPTGLALLHELQSYTDTGSIPVIVCTTLSNITLEDLEPYGVKRLIDTTSMQPSDIVAAVRSVTISVDEDDA
jgi:DNA-binding response OmpR family regulator